VLAVTGTNLTEFISYAGEPGSSPGQWRLPIIRPGQFLGDEFFDDDGNPTGQQWDAVVVMHPGQDSLFAMEIRDQTMMPVFRKGGIIVVSPSEKISRGDRVVVWTDDGRILIRELIRRTSQKIFLRHLNHQQAEAEIAMDHVSWIARIMWAGQ
jgi:phage repressor protein C with HTH and peptisase S24 domain